MQVPQAIILLTCYMNLLHSLILLKSAANILIAFSKRNQEKKIAFSEGGPKNKDANASILFEKSGNTKRGVRTCKDGWDGIPANNGYVVKAAVSVGDRSIIPLKNSLKTHSSVELDHGIH